MLKDPLLLSKLIDKFWKREPFKFKVVQQSRLKINKRHYPTLPQAAYLNTAVRAGTHCVTYKSDETYFPTAESEEFYLFR